jgi:hypothetical protein
MQRTFFLRGITLLFFISMLTGFLLYRSGKLDKYFSKERNSSDDPVNIIAANSSQMNFDTVPVSKDSVEKLRMFSSKSMVLTEKKIWRSLPDSSKKKKKKTILSSSKSGAPFRESDIKLSYDSLRFDTIHTPTQMSKKPRKQ